MHNSSDSSPSGDQSAIIFFPVTSLPIAPPGADTDWQERAVCAQTDPESFYPEKGCSPRDGKAVCAGCPVRKDCLHHAITAPEYHGIWGGLTRKERNEFQQGGWSLDQIDEFLQSTKSARGVRHAS
ncbi:MULTISPECIES: WhiB family transcriptional regulator [Mycolicibacterium]|uniref:WhiB family transcriptional regulator n=1 Tax=Mycolicibacterium TaxID=1866885 RepID=UPI001CDC422E|nr:WhiB family transcriptional regulator [Mycolicibacterium fortuitum]